MHPRNPRDAAASSHPSRVVDSLRPAGDADRAVNDKLDVSASVSDSPASVLLSQLTITRTLVIVVVFFTMMGALESVLRYALGQARVYGLSALFNLGKEQSLPTWYSSSALLLCSILLYLMARRQVTRGDSRRWLGLAGIFLFLSADESVAFHEAIADVVRSTLGPKGFLYYGWVIPYFIFVLIVVLVYWRFVLELPRALRRVLILAGATYVAGALGMEMVQGYVDYYGVGPRSLLGLLIVIEESLEMAAIVLFIYALLDYLRSHDVRVGIGT
jgi:hypothetical protein